jgi:hypothetical protein
MLVLAVKKKRVVKKTEFTYFKRKKPRYATTILPSSYCGRTSQRRNPKKSLRKKPLQFVRKMKDKMNKFK